jgi:hypothetical protein
VGIHEEDLLAVLEKIGQSAAPRPNNEPQLAAVEDADSPDFMTETAGPSEPPVPADPIGDAPPEIVGTPERVHYAPVTKANLWVHHDTHPVVLDLVLVEKYKGEWFSWKPETLWREIKDDFRVPSIHDHVKAKVQAMKTLHISDAFWNQWEVFCWINQALNNNLPDFRVLQKPTVSQLLNTVDIATMTRPEEEFSLEIQSFIAAAMMDEGVFYAPDPIKFCQDEIEQLLTSLKLDHTPDIIRQVQTRFDEVRVLSDETWQDAKEPILKETVVDVQAAKLLVAWNYLSMRRRQMQLQLKLL